MNQSIVVSLLEWSEDYGFLNYSQEREVLAQKEKDGWRTPTPEEFAHAKQAGIGGFKNPDANYWTEGDHGDALTTRPNDPEDISICNSYKIRNGVRLVRLVGVLPVKM